MIGKYAAIAAVGALCIAGQASAKDAVAQAKAAPVAASKVNACVAEAKAKGTAVQASCLNAAGLVANTQGASAQSMFGLSGLQLAGLVTTVVILGVGISNVLDTEKDPVSP